MDTNGAITAKADADISSWQTAYVSKIVSKKKNAMANSPFLKKKKKVPIPETESQLKIADPLMENPFSLLNEDMEVSVPTEQVETDVRTPERKPPPLFIPSVSSIHDMMMQFNNCIDRNAYTYKSNRDGQLRVMVNSSQNYRAIVRLLDQQKIVYHTYQLKEERAFRVVIKNLHHITSTEYIAEKLSLLGHRVRQVTNAISKVNKKPLSLFFVDLEPDANNKHVYSITLLCNAIVKLEPPKKFNDLVQCHRCQEFGHTKSYCSKPFRCVKCAQSHSSVECLKEGSAPATCVHCGEAHAASYKGYVVYQTMKKKSFPTRQSNRQTRTNGISSDLNTRNFVSKNVSYATITAGKHSSESAKQDSSISGKIDERLIRLEQLMEKQLEQSSKFLNQVSTLLQLVTSLLSNHASKP